MYPNMPVIIPSNEQYKQLAERRIVVVKKMTDALFEYLTFDYQLAIDSFNDPVKTKTETLISAIKQRDSLQTQLDQAQELADKMKLPEGLGDMAMFALTGGLRQQLEAQNEWISQIQAELEKEQKQ